MYKFIKVDEKGNIKITEEELEKLLSEEYQRGLNDGAKLNPVAPIYPTYPTSPFTDPWYTTKPFIGDGPNWLLNTPTCYSNISTKVDGIPCSVFIS